MRSTATGTRWPGKHTPERCLEAAFGFLLDREPKESIIGRFNVTLISRYFPEFERELPRYLSPSWLTTSFSESAASGPTSLSRVGPTSSDGAPRPGHRGRGKMDHWQL